MLAHVLALGSLLLSPQDPFREAVKSGAEKLEAGNYEGAIADFTAAVNANPKSPTAYYYRGLARVYQGDHDSALEDLTKSIALKPAANPAYGTRGWLRGTRQDHDGAVADLTKALEREPSDGSHYFFRGRAHYDAGRWAEAEKDYSQACRFKTGAYDGSIRLHLWLAAARKKSTEEAEKALREHFGKRSDDPESRLAGYLLGDLDAEQVIGPLAGLKDKDAHRTRCQAHFFVASRLLIQGYVKAAKKAFEAAVATQAREWRDWGSAAAEAKRLASE